MTILLSSLINSGGGGLPIDSVQPFNDTVNVKTDSNLNTWLKSGVLETDTTLYPDAFKSNSYTGTNFSVSAQVTAPEGIAWDSVNSKFWVVDGGAQRVYRYNPDGTYDNFNFDVSGQDAFPLGITFDGTNLWIVGLVSKAVYSYTTAGAYRNVSFSVSGQDSQPQGIAWGDTHFYVGGLVSNEVFRYTAAGVYDNFSFSIPASVDSTIGGLTWVDNNIWIIGTANDSAYMYSPAGVYSEVNFPISGEDNNPFGIAHDGNSFSVIGGQSKTVYQYQEAVGLPDSSTDTDTGLPIYVRVK